MKVKVNVSVFLGVVLCVALMGGMWLMRGKNAAGDAAWNPNRIYSTVGGAQYSSGAFSSSRSEGLDVSVPMSSSRTYHRATPSFASAYNAAASAVASRQSSMPSAQSPISYTSSAANYHSFGGGNAVASGASAGSFRASNNNPGAPASLSVPSMPTYASARTISASQSEQAAQASSAIVAAAPAYMSSGYPYNTMCGSIAQVGANAVPATYGGSSVFGGPRYLPPTGGGYDAWLNGLGAGEGFLYVDGEGNRYYDMDLLKETFEKLKSEGNLPGYLSWEEFLEQYFSQTGKHNVPLGEAWVLLLMAVACAVLRWRRSKFAL